MACAQVEDAVFIIASDRPNTLLVLLPEGEDNRDIGGILVAADHALIWLA